jgi:hypothetical protein
MLASHLCFVLQTLPLDSPSAPSSLLLPLLVELCVLPSVSDADFLALQMVRKRRNEEEEGGRRKEEGGGRRRKEEGGKRKEEGGRKKE